MKSRTLLNRLAVFFAFVLGLLCLGWVGAGFVGTGGIALAMCSAIALVYLVGAWEVWRFRALSASLAQALAQPPKAWVQLSDWLTHVPAALQATVRQRVQGERAVFPGLSLTPYLIGLLVMLGMLGTFLGMVVTFKGAVFALEGSADLSAIRSALAAPIKGLGLAFGTSVAGVATSAMLGLMAALSRGERVALVRALDLRIHTDLRPFSLAHRREQSDQAMLDQASAFPAVAAQLQALMEQIDQRNLRLDEQLLNQQNQFHREAAAAYTQLGESVARSLTDTLERSARAAGETIQPVVASAMAALALEAERRQTQVSDTVQTQLLALGKDFAATTASVADTWTRALAQHERGGEQLLQGLAQSLTGFNTVFEERAAQLLGGVQAAQDRAQTERAQAEQAQQAALTQALERMAHTLQTHWQAAGEQAGAQQQAVLRALDQTARAITQRSGEEAGRSLEGVARLIAQTETLVQARAASETAWTQTQGERMDQLASLWRSELSALRQEEGERNTAAAQRATDLQTALATQLATLGTALEAPMARLMHTASEAPKAAAEVITQLREHMGRLAERDGAAENASLVERAALVAQISQLLQQVQQTTAEQRAAIDNLVGSATGVLNRVGQQFANTVGAQTGRAEAMAEQAANSAAQLAGLGEAFQQGTNQLATSHEQLVHSLQQVEGAIGQSRARSDEQLAYYVAQAREVIDLSISAQQGIVEDLRQLRGSLRHSAKAQAPAAAENPEGVA